jgi:hypothetical protein
MGYENGRAKMWRMEAFPSKSQADWQAFLGRLGGAPARVVCDNDMGMTRAVGAVFPDAELYLCEWHLRHALERLMKKPAFERVLDGLADQLRLLTSGRYVDRELEARGRRDLHEGLHLGVLLPRLELDHPRRTR